LATGIVGNGRTRHIVGTSLILIIGIMMLTSSGVKFAHVPKIVEEFNRMGFEGNKQIGLAALEALSTLLFLFPRTRAFGLLMISAYLGGAIATHIQHNQSPLSPAIVLAMIWLAIWLRHPQALWSVRLNILSDPRPDISPRSSQGTI
jgi:hypothetical protein